MNRRDLLKSSALLLVPSFSPPKNLAQQKAEELAHRLRRKPMPDELPSGTLYLNGVRIGRVTKAKITC